MVRCPINLLKDPALPPPPLNSFPLFISIKVMSTPTTSRLITEATASLSLSTSSSPKLTSSIAAAPKTPSTLSPLLGANSGIGGISMSHSVSHSSCLDLAASSIENQKSKGVVEPYADAVTPLQFPKPVIPGPIPNNYSINYNNSSSSSSTKYSNNFDHSVLKPSPTLLASTTIPTSVNIPASSSSLPPALQEEEHDYVRLILTARVYDACKQFVAVVNCTVH